MRSLRFKKWTKLNLINCFQNEVCSNYISHVGLFMRFFCLTNFSSEAFYLSETG